MGYIAKLVSSNEKILAQRRPHWVVLLNAFAGLLWQVFLLAIVYFLYVALTDNRGPLAGAGFLMKALDDLRQPLRFLSPLVPLAVGALLLLSSLVGVLRITLNWVNTTLIVTNRRVIQIHGVIAKTSIDSSLEKVNDILLKQPALGRILDYGHLLIMTASETGLNRMLYVPDPVGFKRAMLDAKNALSGPAPAPVAPLNSAADRLTELSNLRAQGLITEDEYNSRRQQVLSQL